MKEYEVKIVREYTTRVTLKFPDDGRNHKLAIENNLRMANELDEGDIWDLIAEKELEQMDINHEQWEINELK